MPRAAKERFLIEYLVPAIAAFLAGILNSIAGGGTFLTFPALVYAGIPPVAANATSAVAVFPGYLGAVAGFRRGAGRARSDHPGAPGDPQPGRRTARRAAAAGLIQRVLLADRALPVARRHRLLRLPGKDPAVDLQQPLCSQALWCERQRAGGGHGGYFNGGLGIVLLALYSLWGMENLNAMNGLRTPSPSSFPRSRC